MAKKDKKSKSGKSNKKDQELLSAENNGKEFDVKNLTPEEKDTFSRIQKLTPEKRKAVCQVTEMMFAGPLPPPEIFQGYENTLAGAADRILTMTEGEAAHRRSMEKRVVTFDVVMQGMGLIFGLIVALACIAGGVWCILDGHPVSGSLLGGTTIISLVGVFVYGSRIRNGSPQSNGGPPDKKQHPSTTDK